MVDLKPNLAAYARVSYFRELHGDLAGRGRARCARAVAAGGRRERTSPYVQTLLGDLELARGRPAAAPARLRAALAACPDYAPAAGRARARSTPPAATCAARSRRWRRVVDAPAAARVRDRARRGRARGRPPRRGAARPRARRAPSSGCSPRAGVNTDVELALFEADHGDPRRGRGARARAAWAAAPSVRSADALGWALTRAGRPADGPARGRAARCGSARATPLVALPRRHRPRAAAGAASAARRWLRARARRDRRSRRVHAPRAARARWRRCDEARARCSSRCSALLVAAGRPAGAHPLGNFSVNHLTEVVGLAPTASTCATCSTRPRSRRSRSAALARRRGARRASAPRSRARLVLTVDGRRVPLRAGRAPRSTPPARAGRAADDARRAAAERAASTTPRRVELRDGTFPGRVGWKAIVAQPGRGHRRALDAPAGDPTDGLRALPGGPARSPLDQRERDVRGAPGDGTLRRPTAERGAATTTDRAAATASPACSPTPPPARACSLLLLLAAFGWGALHALSPGPRQGDGRRLPRRHARDRRATRSRSARRSRSPTRSASSRSGS